MATTLDSKGTGGAGAGGRPQRHRGLFTIPVTPFADDGTLDETSLRRLIAFCVEAGAHGIVTPVNASEFVTLTPDERAVVTRIAVAENERAGARGRVPVVIGVGARTTPEAVHYAQMAQDSGADAVIAMPAYDPPLDETGIYDFYSALADVVHVPIYIQNHDPIGPTDRPRPGTPLSPELMARMCREIDHVRYIKEESANTGHKIVKTLDLAGDACWGIMGGKAGRYLLDEYRRGACGTMPASEITDLHAHLWNTLDGGDERGARDLFNAMLPLLNYEAQYGAAVYKEVLYRRRIITSPFKRLPGLTLDAYDQQELDAILQDLAPRFRVKTAWRRPK